MQYFFPLLFNSNKLIYKVTSCKVSLIMQKKKDCMRNKELLDSNGKKKFYDCCGWIKAIRPARRKVRESRNVITPIFTEKIMGHYLSTLYKKL